MIAALVVAAALAAAPPPPVTGSHAGLDCADCHGRDRPADCWECHEAADNPHPVGIAPSFPLPEGFELGPDGALLCRTCHRLHGGDPDHAFLRAPAGVTRLGFCIQCHGASLEEADPHKARRGEGRCGFCHRRRAGRLVVGRGTARLEIRRLCNFCHDVLAKGHPRNVDPDLSLPSDVPLGPGGEWTCFTCHDPHGTTATTHLLRPRVVRHLERGNEASPHVAEYFACRGCHTSSDPDAIRPPDFRLRFRGDVNVLCISCHLTDRSHHPTGLRPPPAMAARMAASGARLPLGPDGGIVCTTCHDTGCRPGTHRVTERFYDRGAGRSDLCGMCHDRSILTQRSPHTDEPAMCATCHVTVPVPGVGGRKGLVASVKMVCLRCHGVNLHPANADHLKVPSERTRPDPGLPLGPQGEVTCATCHNPHASPEHRPARLRDRPGPLCSRCHSF